MLIFLYGPDSYRRRQKSNEIIRQYKQKYSSVGNFDFNEKNAAGEFNRLREFCASYSLFENAKMAVVENILTNFAKSDDRKNQKAVIDFLKSNLKNKELTILISEEKAPLKAFDFLLKKPVLAQEFKNLTSGQFEFFIKKESESRGVNLDFSAISFLTEIFQGDSWGLINELEKLALIGLKKISADDLKKIIDYGKPVISSDFFKQVNNFAFSRGAGQKIANLEILLEREEPAKIFNFLASFSSNSPDLTRKFADYDIAVKSGKMDYEEALVDLAISS